VLRQARRRCQYSYFCTSKASRWSSSIRAMKAPSSPHAAPQVSVVVLLD
jgi:hypothetical protein